MFTLITKCSIQLTELNESSSFRASSPKYHFTKMQAELISQDPCAMIDAAKIICWALENSCSIAAMVLTTEALVVEIPEKKSSVNSDGMNDLPV